jgi:aspartate/methionine/tyrosine aminotransferase
METLMNPLAQELNDRIAAVNPHVVEMLSALGRDLYFPKGILSQSAEAKKLATRFNATIGTALEDGNAMNLEVVMRHVDDLSPNETLLYAPSPGVDELRNAWREKILADNPTLRHKPMSLPVVTSGLTHGLSVLADLFIDAGDVLLLPDKIWGNYKLIFAVRRHADIRQYPFFHEGGFHIDAFRQALRAACAERDKVVVLLNFPNNPTGYAPTVREGEAIAEALIEAAEAGTNIVAVTDDAYFGLFFEAEVMRESLFTRLADAHPRLLAVKADAATKEAYVWGLRIGFLTYSTAGADTGSPLYEALCKKTGGCIRGAISNTCRLSQTIVARALADPEFFRQRADKVKLMAARARKVKEVLANPEFSTAWEAYPFNSGYFMCLRLKQVNAEQLRTHMLRKYGVGTIAIGDHDLRIAFSCLEEEQIPELFALLFAGCCDLSA